MTEPSRSDHKNPLRRLRSSLRALGESHAERHRPSGFGFIFADRIDYLDAAKWDSLAASGGFFLRRDVLRVIEDHGAENIAPRYAMVFSGAKPVALLAAQLVTVTGERLHRASGTRLPHHPKEMLKRLVAPAARSVKNRLRERLLVAGNLLSWGFHGVAFAPGEDPARLWPGITEALYRLRRAERLGGPADFVMVKDLAVPHAGTDALRTFGYRPLETEPNMVLALDPTWKTYDDYVAALDAKYRRKIKDLNKKLAAGGCELISAASLGGHAGRLHELYLAVQGNAAVKLVTVKEAYLAQLAAAVGADFRCTLVKRGDQVLGFVTSVRDGDTAIGYYIGFDRAAAAEGLPIYLALLQSTVADAIHWRCRRLSLGRTALEPKAGLGAKPEPMAVWVRHRVPAVNYLLRGLLGAVPHDEAPERNPFKTAPANPPERAPENPRKS
jgi:hypothetical protein